MNILITGITGFAGSFLAEHLLHSQTDVAISGTYISESSKENVKAIKDRLHLEKVDLTDYNATSQLVAKTNPDVLYHLAAISTIQDGFKNPGYVISNNASAQINILEALREQKKLKTKVIIISSASIYGKVHERDLPIDEETPLRPENPYAVSKIAQDFIALQYFLSYDMHIIRLRPFNHIGPRLNPELSISYFAKQIALAEKNKIDPVLGVGNLSAKRDFTDVRDMVQGYSLAAEKGKVGDVYNLGSGVVYEIGKMLDILLSMSRVKIAVKRDKGRMRPSDIPLLCADASKFMKLTGWKPKIPIEKTLKDLLEYWRSQT